MTIRKVVDAIPAVFLPPKPAGRSSVQEVVDAIDGRPASPAVLREAMHQIADIYNDRVRDLLLPERPPIFGAINRRGIVTIAIGRYEIERVKEAVKLYPTMFFCVREMD